MSDAATPEPHRARASATRLFNMETMSGVFPGTRTQLFQRVRVRRTAAPVGNRGGEAAEEWLQILWRDAPPAVYLHELDMQSGRVAPEPMVVVADPLAADFGRRLEESLAARALQLTACGSCAQWRPTGSRTADGLPLGVCSLQRAGDASLETPPMLAAQSLLALDCPHWSPRQPGSADDDRPPAPQLPMAPLPKAAEISESKKPWAQRMALRVRRRLLPQPSSPSPAPSLADSLVERSGVGAGTEPCFACQGRIANLGALTVASPEGDKQTFSVWRCRVCHTLYLSDWIDRWERVDSLETEETIYRIAPVEAAELLALVGSVAGGDHPRLRRERGAQRAWVLEQLARRPALSHVIKQGR